MKNFTRIILISALMALNPPTSEAQEISISNHERKNPDKTIDIISIDDTEIMWPDIPYQPKATVKNLASAFKDFVVTMEIDGFYKCSRKFQLSPLSSVTVLFDSASIPSGKYTFTVTAFDVENPDHPKDSLSGNVTIPARIFKR